MKVQLKLVYAGVRRFDFKDDSGKTVKGCRVYVVDTDHQADENLLGYTTGSHTANYDIYDQLYKLQPMKAVTFEAEMTPRNDGGFRLRLTGVVPEITNQGKAA